MNANETLDTRIIAAELDAAEAQLSKLAPAVSIFGSARIKPDHADYAITIKLARALSDAGYAVLSGGGPGLMEAANIGAQAGVRESVGLNIYLPHEQNRNPHQDVVVNFNYFFTRKSMFIRHSCAIICVPGGIGTLDELTEALTLIQTGKCHDMPVILFGVAFWTGFVAWYRDVLLARGLIGAEDVDKLYLTDDIAATLAHIKAFKPAH